MFRTRLAILLAAMQFLLAPAVAEDALGKGRLGEFALSAEEFDASATVYRHDDWVAVSFEIRKPLQGDDRTAALAVYVQRNNDVAHRFIVRPCAASDRHEVQKLDGGFWKPVNAGSWHVGRVTKQVAKSWRAIVWLDATAMGGSVDETWKMGFSVKSDFENAYSSEHVLSGEGLESIDLAKLRDKAKEAESKPEEALESEARVIEALEKAAEEESASTRCNVLLSTLSAEPHDPAIIAGLLDAAIAGFDDPELPVSFDEVLDVVIEKCPGWFRAHELKLNRLTAGGEAGAAADYFEDLQPSLGRSGARGWEPFFKAGCEALINERRWKALRRCVDSLCAEDFSPMGLQGLIKKCARHMLAAGLNEVASDWRDCLIKATEEPAEAAALRNWWVDALLAAGCFGDALDEAKALLGDEDFSKSAESVESLAHACVIALGAAYDPPDVPSASEELLKAGEGVWTAAAIKTIRDYTAACEAALEDWQAELKYRDVDKTKKNPRVRIEVDGRILVIELFEDDAPNTVANFVSLVREGFYENRAFYRRVDGWLIQGGGPDDTGASQSEWTIKNEDNYRQHWRGTIAMARTQELDTATTHFFITIGNTKPSLELKTDWVVFGWIVEGFEVAQKIQKGDRITKTSAENLRDHDYKPQRIPAKD